MAGPRPPAVGLSGEERRELERLVRAHTTGQTLVLRARIILAAADGRNNAQIERALGCNVETASIWRRRWRKAQEVPLAEVGVAERLADAPRPGAVPRITAEQVCQIIALACEQPDASGRPISQWSHRELADEIVQRGIVDGISPRHAGRLLQGGRSQTASDPVLVDTGHHRTRRAARRADRRRV
jgi:putative transposase